jgi:mycothiol synthase
MKTEERTELELTFRPWRRERDAEAMAALANAANLADGVDEHESADGLLNFFGRDDDHFVADRDLVLVEHEGTLVASANTFWVDTRDGLREHRVHAFVHPDWTRRGIGHQVLAWLEARARTALAEHPTDAPAVYGTWCPEARVAKRELVEAAGYEPVRWFFEMERTGLGQVDVPPLPDGLEIRPIGTDRASLRRLFDADVEAFLDHWGGFPATDATFSQFMEGPDTDPSLFVVAWDGDEIAGGVVNTIYRHDNEAFGRRRGWLDSVFVRRPWRRRGLGAALVARSLVVLREAGMDSAMLGVDADNPTGALGIYERAGFTVAARSTAYRKPTPPQEESS